MSTKKKKNFYLPPEVFKEIYEEAVKNNKPSLKLFDCFRLLAENLSKLNNNTSQKDKDAIINYAISEAWRKWDKFNPEVSKNLFSFFTSMINNDMKTHYNLLFNKNKNKNGEYKFVSIEKLFNGNDK